MSSTASCRDPRATRSRHARPTRLLFFSALSLAAALGGCEGQAPDPDPVPSPEPLSCAAGTQLSPLPKQAVTCVVESGLPLQGGAVEKITWTWDPATRTLFAGRAAKTGLRWIYDEHGREISYGQLDNGSEVFTYRSEYDGAGQRSVYDGERFTNTVDGNGRLLTSTETSTTFGTPLFRTTYHHDDQGRLVLEEADQGEDGTVEYTTTRHYDHGCSLSTRDEQGRTGAPGAYHVAETFFYDGQGRLQHADADGSYFGGSPSGHPVQRDVWTYDDAGRLVRFEEDGTTGDVGGPLDGKPDLVVTFSEGCGPLVSWRRDIFHFPN